MLLTTRENGRGAGETAQQAGEATKHLWIRAVRALVTKVCVTNLLVWLR
jgi:hypothetical protein